MTYALLTFFALALYHFIYEAIVAPSLRLDLRFRLFALRDELRNLKIENASALDDKHFRYLHESINVSIAYLNQLDFKLMATIDRAVKSDINLQKRADERSKLMDDCTLEAAKRIRRRAIRFVRYAMVVNSGGWIIYVVPILFALGCVDLLNARLKRLTAIPESEMERRFPAEEVAPALC